MLTESLHMQSEKDFGSLHFAAFTNKTAENIQPNGLAINKNACFWFVTYHIHSF